MSDLIKQRPKFLDLTAIRQPLAAKASILHRVSGVGLFLMLPLLIWLLQLSLASSESFALFKAVTGHPVVKLVLFGLLWAFLHHFCMGIRILLIDIQVGVEKQASAASAKAVMVVSLVLTAVLGAKLFGAY